MNKFIFSAAVASTILLAPIGAALADPGPESTTVCTSINANNSSAPSGAYVDANGRKWVGFNSDGTPPDSLTASGGTSTTCVTVSGPL